jgi:hypothetical protein
MVLLEPEEPHQTTALLYREIIPRFYDFLSRKVKAENLLISAPPKALKKRRLLPGDFERVSQLEGELCLGVDRDVALAC